ncbi:MAG: penicillin-binding protein 2 [Anaerolineae bacterium]
MKDSLSPRLRINIFKVIVVLSFVGLTIQLYHLQIVGGEAYRLQADRNRFRLVPINAPRGVFYDRQGRILVRNVPSFTVSLVPADLPSNPQEQEVLFARLSALLDIPVSSQDELAHEALSQQGPLFESSFPSPSEGPRPGIKELLDDEAWADPFSPVPIKTNVEREVAFILEEEHLNLPGVRVQIDPLRHYLQGSLTSHILGYMGGIPRERVKQYVEGGYSPNDRVGLAGLELTFEEELRGAKGQKLIEVDALGREIRTLEVSEPKPGHNLTLTIDLELQAAVEAALREGMRAAGSESGIVIVMDPRSGKILSLVSLPSYDNNLFAGGISAADYETLIKDPLRPLFNRAICGEYPLGSTFKIVPAAAALQDQIIDRHTQIMDTGVIWVPNKYAPDDPTLAQPFYGWYRPGLGLLNVEAALAWSSDIFFYEVAGGFEDFQGLGIERLVEYTKLFGFGEMTGIELPGEIPGLVPTERWKRLTYAESWVTGDTYNMAIGQGFLLASPLQILNATAAVVNGGTLYRPQIVYQITDTEGHVIRPFMKEVLNHLNISEEHLDLIKQGLRGAVTYGTAQEANLAQLAVAGKTGTAEFPGPRDRRGRLPTHAWFTAYAPADDPQVVMVVFVENGGEGSQVAVPIAREILKYYFGLPEDAPLVEPEPAPDSAPEAAAPAAPAPAPTPAPPTTFKAKLVGVEEWGAQISALLGTVVDKEGHGIPGVQLAIDGGGNPVFWPVTGPNGEFSYDFMNAYSSPRWNIRLVGQPDAEVLTIDVEPNKRYIVQFYQTGP